MYDARPVRHALAAALTSAAVLAGALAACGAPPRTGGPAPPPFTQQRSSVPPLPSATSLPRTRLAGFSVPGYPPDPSALDSAETATKIHANIVSWYTPLSQPFDPGAAAQVASGGALPVLEIDSDSTPLSSIASGDWDGFLTGYARAVAAYGAPIAIDFDHEFNGNWSVWGPRLNTARSFVAAWRRIVTIFRRTGADNVIWVWNPNVNAPNVADMRPWYPGDQYVTWTGIDGYFFTRGDTYASVFPATLRELATITAKPVLIVETGASPGPGRAAQITSLFAGLRNAGNVIGVIWFDYDKGTGDNWRLEDDAASVSAFRAGAGAYIKQSVAAKGVGNTRSG